ncbi:serine hydrolase domain-containing protein [Maribacter polysiphoniae]|uniref:serine hydrolase domain-containing protein n=1 Tax=Maribacter polysiphoniae TaxID=429344 RepID=UPI002353CC24|nr:serine hydrolase domain-containing protein [Maribacter polysiphoniae]
MSKYQYILVLCSVYACGYGQINILPIGLAKKQTELILKKAKNFPNRTQIAFGIIDDGIVNYFGVELSNDSIFTTKNYSSVFEIGSVTKVFTTTLLADFTLDNKLNLEDKINSYLDAKINNNTEISYKQLANHTSGLPRLPTNLDLWSVNPNNPYQNYNEQQLKLYLTNELKLSHIPGTHYEYSNLGIGLLGYVLSKIESTAYEDLLKTYIFSKYNMSHSTTDQKKVEGLMVKGLDRSGNITSNWDLGVLVAAGGMLSTTEDLSKFVVAQFDATNKELQLTRTKTFTINNISDYGLGWEIIKRRSGAI